MSTQQSAINVNSKQYTDNRKAMLDLIQTLNSNFQKAQFQGKEKHIQKARKRNKLLAKL